MSAEAATHTRALVVHPDIARGRAGPDGVPARTPELALDEAVALARALPGLEVAGTEMVRLARPHPGTLFGKGKLEELRARIEREEIELLLVDGPVSPVQQRNLETALGLKVLDRTGLILEIFSDRAATREGVLQVEMAALSYQRTRLVRAWTHLERQRGGFGFVGGPGETQIEADRRAIDDQLVRLRRQLDKVVRTRALHRAARARTPFPIVALVGYTNAGKSTLFNRLTGAEVVARDMLFATLDPTMRRIELPGQQGTEVIVSDTVGFITDLPTELVAAFRATLEEVTAADLIVHVRDISHPESDVQAADVEAILESLGVARAVPRIEVWNKIDRLDGEMRQVVENRAARSGDHSICLLSAVTGEGMEALAAMIRDGVAAATHVSRLSLGFDDGRRRAWLYDRGLVEAEEQDDDGYRLSVRWSARQQAQFERL
ncbi:MAG: GTPase HflX [Roseovarius sp.]|nr:GTPase HflX [Roseovarius sp.]